MKMFNRLWFQDNEFPLRLFVPLHFSVNPTLPDPWNNQNVCMLSATVFEFKDQPVAVLRRTITRRACAEDGKKGKYVGDSLKAI